MILKSFQANYGALITVQGSHPVKPVLMIAAHEMPLTLHLLIADKIIDVPHKKRKLSIYGYEFSSLPTGAY